MQDKTVDGKIVLMILAVVVIAILVSSAVTFGFYGFRARLPGNGNNRTSTVTQQITMSQAVQTFKNYLVSLRNPSIALHEVEEYQYNFYASYYENNTGIFAFQMLIWKPGASYMMGMMSYTGTAGVAVPEMGPNMMWNTKYHVAGGMMSGSMMGSGMMGNYGQGTSTAMTITGPQAKTLAQQYLNSSLTGKMAGDVDTYYGYYNIDVLSDGSTFGMLSVNGYTGQVWYHTWHGAYFQTVLVS
jgi:hypothetical protein